jgi:flagellar hook-associated protein 2
LIEPFTAKASNSAVQGSYQIAVTQIASGSRIETDDAAFSSTTDSVAASDGSLTFKVGATTDTFSINVTAGMTLQQLSSAINASDDNFGVQSSIIDTGTVAGGAKLVFTSSVTGAGNDLIIVNDNNVAGLNRVATIDTSSNLYLAPEVGKAAKNSKASLDGILVESPTEEFENTIANVSFEVSEKSASEGVGLDEVFKASTLKIGFDTEGLDKKIRDFVDNFNSLNKEITNLTRYGLSDLEEDGALAGDSMVRSIQNGMGSIIGSGVSASALGGLFELGIDYNDDGDLEISSSDKFGFGSGEDRLKDALDDNFDEIAALFSDADEGIATRLYSYVKEYTTFSGLLTSRERSVKDQKDQLLDERELFEFRMSNTEQILRDKYLNLDQTVARLNQTGAALLASLG